MIIPFYLPPRASLRKIQWDDHSNGSGCHWWDFLYIRSTISIISPNTQDILYEGYWLLHSTFLLTGKWRLQMVQWLIQDYTTEPVVRPRSLPWSLHSVLIIRWPSLKCLKKYTVPKQCQLWQSYYNTYGWLLPFHCFLFPMLAERIPLTKMKTMQETLGEKKKKTWWKISQRKKLTACPIILLMTQGRLFIPWETTRMGVCWEDGAPQCSMVH